MCRDMPNKDNLRMWIEIGTACLNVDRIESVRKSENGVMFVTGSGEHIEAQGLDYGQIRGVLGLPVQTDETPKA